MIEIRDSQYIDIPEILPEVRLEDKLEASRLGVNLDENMKITLDRAVYKKTAFLMGRPIAMWGVVGNLFSDYGVPYLLTSDRISLIPVKTFVRIYKEELEYMATLFPRMSNVVDSSYTGAVRLMKIAGFKLSEPRPIGINGEMFQMFSLGN